ncbi:MAG: DSBA-like thioredoxin domain protein [Betaproteobacteria bacterium]|jgi:predicted DsbA family dithiol-disulfide isomerase|nr:DSBA-like thioredoxin domain protein [Betaproteobacteria bacterium]
MDMSEPLRVDVVFDFVCPWCYIGKRRLEAALDVWKTEHPDDPEPVVRWLPFQLNPDIPAGGISRREHMELKHGPAGPSPEKQEHVAALGRRLGLAFELDRITVQPNTLDAHRLSGCAQRQGWQDEMVEALFRAFFMQGISLNDHEALAGLAASVGFDWSQVATYLASATDVRAVESLELEARNAGIDIVPFFVFNGKITVSGAHEVKVLLQAMDQATTTEAASVVE